MYTIPALRPCPGPARPPLLPFPRPQTPPRHPHKSTQVRLRTTPGPPSSNLDDVEVTALTFWRIVRSGRKLFVRGFFAYHNFVVQHYKHLVDPDAWVSLQFYLRYDVVQLVYISVVQYSNAIAMLFD